MSSTMDGTRLKDIRISGSSFTGQLQHVTTGVDFSMSIDQVTSMTFGFVDDYILSLFRSRLMDKGATISYGEWDLTIDTVELAPSDVGPHIKAEALSTSVYRLRQQTGAKTWTNAPVSQWFRDQIASVGADFLVEPGLGTKTIVREASTERGTQSTWDVMAQVRREVGAWLFERGRRFIVGRPSWIIRQIGDFQEWPLTWNDWYDYTPALQGFPTYTGRTGGTEQEQLQLSLLSPDADQVRLGDRLTLNGHTVGPMGGGWLVTDIGFPMSNTGPVTLTCLRAVDPAREEATQASGLGAGNPNPITRPAQTVSLSNLPESAAGYSGAQLTNAAHIIRASQAAGLSRRAAQIGVMTAIGETTLRVLNYGTTSNPTGRGIFQQGDTGWGTYECRMDPYCSAAQFYTKLRAVPGWDAMEPTQAAHAVQGNADPNYYQQFWSDAVAVVESITSTTTASGGVNLGGQLPPELSAAVDRYINATNGRSIDVDKLHGAQCVDLTHHYTIAMGGPPIWGNGRDWWLNGRRSGFYQGINRTDPARKGDVACWGSTAPGGQPGHAAVVIQDQGTTLRCLTQNPGPVTIMNLAKHNLDGYLRPKAWR